MADIHFFGNIDKDIKGNVTSQMPAWFFPVHLEYLEEDVARKKRQLERGEIPPEHAFMVKNEILQKENKISEIKNTKPKLIGGQKDMVSKQYFDLQNKIADSMPSKRDFQEGYVDARSELKRAKDYHIPVKPELAKACNIKTVKGKITGDDANRMYRMMGHVLGENTNIERIRKEGRSESQRSMEDLTRRIIEKVAG